MAVGNVYNSIANNQLIQGNTQAKETDKLHQAAKSESNVAVAKTELSSVDSVQITDQAKRLSSLQEQIKASPDVDMAKVSAIKSAINSGNYKIDGQAIAQKMIGVESDLATIYG